MPISNPVLQELNRLSDTVYRGQTAKGEAKVTAAEMALREDEFRLKRPALELQSQKARAEMDYLNQDATPASIFGDDMWAIGFAASNERGKKDSTIIDGMGRAAGAKFTKDENDPNRGYWVKPDGARLKMLDFQKPAVKNYLAAKLDPEKVYRDNKERGEEMLLREGKNPQAVANANKMIAQSDAFFASPEEQIKAFRKQRSYLSRLPGNHKEDIAYVDKRISEITAAATKMEQIDREKDLYIGRKLIRKGTREDKAGDYTIEEEKDKTGDPTGRLYRVNKLEGTRKLVTDAPPSVTETKTHVDTISALSGNKRAEYVKSLSQVEYSAVMAHVQQTEAAATTPGKREDFNVEGAGYDMSTAKEAGMGPGKNRHWGSLDPRTGMVLKGRKHPTWNLMEEEEKRRGSKIVKKGGRYYSVPAEEAATKPPKKETSYTGTIKSSKVKPTYRMSNKEKREFNNRASEIAARKPELSKEQVASMVQEEMDAKIKRAKEEERKTVERAAERTKRRAENIALIRSTAKYIRGERPSERTDYTKYR